MDIVYYQEGDHIPWGYYSETMIFVNYASRYQFWHVDATDKWLFCEIIFAYDDLFLESCGYDHGTVHIIVPNKTRVRGFIDIILFEYTGLLHSKYS